MILPFGEWLPDQKGMGNPGASVAKNVIPTSTGYRPVLDSSDYTSALGSNPTLSGLFMGVQENGTGVVFAGTREALWKLDTDQTWDDVSKSGGYTIADWDFAQFGDTVVAVDFGKATQYFEFGVSSVFADLTGSPPDGTWCANIRNFLVIGDIASITDGPHTVKWSGYNNITEWTPSRATQADQRTLDPKYGRIQRIVPGQTGIVFQERAIWTMDYVGPPVIFNFSLVSNGKGTPAPRSVCWYGDKIFYLGDDGFYQYPNIPIGSEKVNQWFYDTVLEGEIADTIGAVDPQNNLVYWAFKNEVAKNFRYMIVYNWVTRKWSYIDCDDLVADVNWLGSVRFTGDLGTDSARSHLVIFDGFERLADFSGSAIPATLETTEYGAGRRQSVNVRPLIEDVGTQVTVYHGTRDVPNDAHTYTSGVTSNSRGVMNFRDPARYHRFKVLITGGFDKAVGLEIEPIDMGLR